MYWNKIYNLLVQAFLILQKINITKILFFQRLSKIMYTQIYMTPYMDNSIFSMPQYVGKITY